MNGLTATVPTISVAPVRAFAALVGSGYRRHATYRQATVAGATTNVVFGFLKAYVLLAVVSAGGAAAGYDAAQIVTFVWVGQGLLTVVLMWSWTELSDRIRSGDVVTDLLRPVPPVVAFLAEDLGRAGYAVLTGSFRRCSSGASSSAWRCRAAGSRCRCSPSRCCSRR